MSRRSGGNDVGRRGFLTAAAAAAVGVVGLTAGQSFDLLAPFNAFGPRVKGQGPQGVPINRTAAQAGVTESARDAGWRLSIVGPAQTLSFSRAELMALPQHDADLPIACVEGWSTMAHWRGVRLSELLNRAGIAPDRTVRFESLQTRGPFRATTMPPNYTGDPLTLVALQLGGEQLDVEHGFPARVIAPGRPGVLQTKWLATISEVRA